MNLTPEQKEHAINLIYEGKQLEALQYLQKTLNISAEEALALTGKLVEEVDGPSEPDEEKENHPRIGDKKGINVGKLVGSIFMTVGTILLVIMGWLINSKNKFEERAVPVTGTVQSYDSYIDNDSDGDRTTMYTPIFNYDYLGKDYTRPGTVSSSGKDYEIGESVEILVDPENPEEVLINSFSEKWLGILILGILGIGFTGLGYLAYRVMSK